MKITVIGKTVQTGEFDGPVLLATALRRMGIPATLPCGGGGRCGNCTVRVEGDVAPPGPEEAAHLAGRPADVRLSCLAQAVGDCTIYLSQKEAHIQTDGVGRMAASDGDTAGVGFAVDIGTTTVAAYAYDRKTGRELARDAFLNPQSVYGGDVISRIDAALKGEAGALSTAIVSALSASFSRLCTLCDTPPEEVSAAVITGNTAMLYLLLGLDVTPLSRAPFAIDDFLGRTLPATEVGLTEYGTMPVYFPPTASAFVGSDITCSMLAAESALACKATLMIDIGTNGEMALFCGDRVVCCSTAAGPAFEGAGILFGCMAGEGAINTVSVEEGTLTYTVLGEHNPTGICGSGLIDAVAAFLELGLIDETGCIADEGRYVTEYEGEPALAIGDSGILLTGRDIRAVQLAKSAICAGALTLLHTVGLEPAQVERLLLAGGFGSYVNCRSAARIGLIPVEMADKAQAIGNAAGWGASLILLFSRSKETADALADRAEVLDLSTHPVFMEKYVEGMLFL